jgi:uncharacterized protein
LRVIQRGLELGVGVSSDDRHAKIVEAYNREDCLSALALRDWLEGVRAGAEADGAEIPRPAEESGEPNKAVGERERRTRALAERLLADTPEQREERSEAQQATWLLAHMLDWHRREEKAPWWEYFRLRELSDEDLLEETAALAGLEFIERVGGTAKNPVDRYRFPRQDTGIRAESELELPLPQGRPFGQVVGIDLAAGTVDVEKTFACAELHPTSAFEHRVVRSHVLADSLLRLGEWVAKHGIDAPGEHRAARDLLLRRRPRLAASAGSALEMAGEGGVAAARRLALALNRSALPIQGPPGSGKTFTGARMICDLVRAGRRVGVCAVSHKVILNLLKEVAKAAEEEGVSARCLRKAEKGAAPEAGIAVTSDNAGVLAALRSRQANVAGGTAWLWAREEYFEAVDVLFVDEAGQMSLANVLAIAQSARSVVLLGDPQQLEQPIQGFHPEGTAVSALEHVGGGDQTIAPDRGLFLEETWRLPPAICDFTSELFYERRLRCRAGLEKQVILGDSPFAGSGLWYVSARHEANQGSSREEVEVVADLVRILAEGGLRWRDRDGVERALGLGDILVIAPYNAQVADLKAELPPDARVGTVDRFQGQEAPVVIYSMTTSTPEDAPRGMEFLYSPNRFNVATSRAQCACIVVGSPRLFEPDCQSPRQMKLANAFCRFLEVAREVRIQPGAAIL